MFVSHYLHATRLGQKGRAIPARLPSRFRLSCLDRPPLATSRVAPTLSRAVKSTIFYSPFTLPVGFNPCPHPSVPLRLLRRHVRAP
jgi:hypothetical protein